MKENLENRSFDEILSDDCQGEEDELEEEDDGAAGVEEDDELDEEEDVEDEAGV
jgi:hypothetical protein